MTEEQMRAIVRGTRLDPFCPSSLKFLGIVDTNALLSSAENDCRYPGRRSRLLRMTDDGSARLYAADHIYSEMYEKVPTFVRGRQVSAVDLRQRFEDEYLRAVRFVTVDSTGITDPQVLAITDSDDVPSGVLAKLVAPCVVFSGDKHLRKPGLAPDDWYAAAQCAIDIIDGLMQQRVTMNVASLPVRGSVELVKFLGRKTTISPWVLGFFIAGGAALLLRTPERRQSAKKYVVPVIEAIGQELEKAHALEQQGLEGLRAAILSGPEAPPIKQQVAITLARQPVPLLAAEVQQVIERHFPEAVPTVQEIRTVLRDNPEFFQIERYRWQFGREAAAWRGSL